MPRHRSHRQHVTWRQWVSSRTRGTIIWLAIVVGILLWARVIIISRIPRTAIADTETGSSLTGDASGAVVAPPRSDPWRHPAVTRRHVASVD